MEGEDDGESGAANGGPDGRGVQGPVDAAGGDAEGRRGGDVRRGRVGLLVERGSWWLFGLLLLAPDVSMLGYLAGRGVGAAVYNVFHSYPLPAVLGGFGLLAGAPLAVAVALVWFAHIGMDRMLGYGLKYGTGFKDTHLGRV